MRGPKIARFAVPAGKLTLIHKGIPSTVTFESGIPSGFAKAYITYPGDSNNYEMGMYVPNHFANTEYDGKVLGWLAECKSTAGVIQSYTFMPFGPAAVDDSLGNSRDDQLSSLSYGTNVFYVQYGQSVTDYQFPYTDRIVLYNSLSQTVPAFNVDFYLAGAF